jgi:hypothetical protein
MGWLDMHPVCRMDKTLFLGNSQEVTQVFQVHFVSSKQMMGSRFSARKQKQE